MEDFRNTRRDDMIKVAKYHYRIGELTVVDVLRRAVAAHCLLPLETTTNADLVEVMIHDLSDILFPNEVSSRHLLLSMIDTHRIHKCIGLSTTAPERTTDAMDVMLMSFITIVSRAGREQITPFNLPDNCPVLEKAMAEF